MKFVRGTADNLAWLFNVEPRIPEDIPREVYTEVEIENVDPSIFTTVEEVRIVEKYDLNDHATAVILYNERTNQYLYHIQEPDLGEYAAILPEVYDAIRSRLIHQEDVPSDQDDIAELVRAVGERYLRREEQLSARLQNKIIDLLARVSDSFAEYKPIMSDERIEKLLYFIERDIARNGRLQPLIDDPYIEDIHVNAPNKPVYIFHGEYGSEDNLMTSLAFEENELQTILHSFAQIADKQISKANPIQEGSLPDGSRLQLVFGDEVNADGSSMTIRLFDDIPLTPIELIQYETFTTEQMAILWLAAEYHKNVMFAGGTAAGKTTSMNALSMFIPPSVKIVSIEDTREVELPHVNWLKHVTRDSPVGDVGAIDMFDLLKSALRERPDFIMVGEVRGSEAQTLFQAMNTGHASTSTFHANTVESAVNRLTDDNIGVNKEMMTALDIICVQRKIRVQGEDVRRITEMREIRQMNEEGKLESQTLYDFDAMDDTYDKQFTGSESELLNDIRQKNSWSEAELLDELNQRERLINYMADEDISDYHVVTNIIHRYMRDPEVVIEAMDTDSLEELASDVEVGDTV